LILLPAGSAPWDANQFFKVKTLNKPIGAGCGSHRRQRYTLPAHSCCLLETYYGNNAASRIRRVEVELTADDFNPSVISGDQVYFGALLQDASDPTKRRV